MDGRGHIGARLGSGADLESLLHDLVEHSPVPYAVFDVAGHCALTNPAYREMFGREPPPEYSVLKDEVAAKLGLADLLRSAFEGATVQTPIFWYDPAELAHALVTDAKRVAIACNLFPLRGDKGQVVYVAIAYQDVTAARMAQAAAEQERDVMRAVLEQSGDGIIVSDAQGTIRIFNPEAERQHGVGKREVGPSEWGSTYQLCTRDGQPLPLAQTPLYRAMKGERVENASWMVRRPDGAERLLAGTAAPLREADGTPSGAVLVTRDETDRLRAEERQRFLAQASATLATNLEYEATLAAVGRLPVPFLADWSFVDSVDDAGTFRRIGVAHADAQDAEIAEKARRFSPHRVDQRAPGTPHRLMDGESVVLFAQVLDDDLKGLAVSPGQLDLMRQIAPVSLMSIPLRARGRTLGVMVLATSRSGRHFGPAELALAEDLAARGALAADNARLYDEARAAIARAEAASRAKDEFLAMLGHELRNPLAPIATAVALLRRRPGLGEREIEVISRQVEHLTLLVDDLLDVSRITSGKVELRKERVLVGELLAAAVEATGPLLDQRRHTLDLLTPAAAASIDVDPMRCKQVLINLLTNAAKYTPPGGHIQLQALEEEGHLLIRVRDSGVGIARDMLAPIFDLFIQGAQSLDRAQGGLGLGLNIVRTLVELHGGKVTVHSDGEGRGSEFVVLLPMVGSAPGKARTTAPHAEGPKAQRKRVLVVDDNEDAALMLAELLALEGHEVRVAHDGASALDQARSFQPQVALVDIGLPVMDGYELAGHLRREGGTDLRLVAVTGYGASGDRKRSQEAGFDLHLVKPVDLGTLEKALGG